MAQPVERAATSGTRVETVATEPQEQVRGFDPHYDWLQVLRMLMLLLLLLLFRSSKTSTGNRKRRRASSTSNTRARASKTARKSPQRQTSAGVTATKTRGARERCASLAKTPKTKAELKGERGDAWRGRRQSVTHVCDDVDRSRLSAPTLEREGKESGDNRTDLHLPDDPANGFKVYHKHCAFALTLY